MEPRRARSFVSRLLRPAVDGLAVATSPSGRALLEGLRHDLDRVPTFDQGWLRLCAAAWALGFTALELSPVQEFEERLAPRTVVGPGRTPASARRASVLDATWCCALVLGDRPIASLSARRGSDMLDFPPGEFVEAAQLLLRRFVGSAAGAAGSS